jgi:hypothetical protein
VVKLVCKLTFPDGKEAAGEVHAASPAVEYPIAYSGTTRRLPIIYERGTASDLELLFTVAAQRTGAKLSVERSGTYDSRSPGR